MPAVSDLLSFSRVRAKTDSNGLTNANGLILVNEALLEYHQDLIERGIDASQVQETYRDGSVPSSGNGSTYLYPTDMFFLKAIELNYTDTNAQNYKRATQVDVSNLQGNMSFGWLRNNASKETPQFDDRGDVYEIFPAPKSSDNLSQLIRLFYFLKPTDYATVSDTIAYPVSLDYRILGLLVAANYLYSLEKDIAGDKLYARYEKRINKLKNILSRGTQQPMQSTGLGLTGYEF